ncbi:MAG: bifunctional diaminohydroxyphosphoribosylaminopyrimidine deaminase/5-amino-6-(5-phosphoribosylamino)uracil reductase RibD [Prevotellaceae bacterium]|nr:bifunctional diaminohydroxyphosphoribosylaminopyrimidine deaminase/5-amino-6-(5-phosphoribosylamino)uracil reductase RibD [Prevotellaceae bacterium]
MTTHEKYMQRCLELARKGAGNVAPNPMVGAVIVSGGEVIGEGFHQCCGEAHAEVNAINAVKDKDLLRKSTLYVNLEPCSHYGKTPPCALKIIECGIPRVVIGHGDPFPKVAGGGIKILRDAGVEVLTDILHAECADLNKRFFTFHEKRRPYIILKWAQTADGFIAPETRQPLKISTPETEKIVHQMRATESAIMVGTRTALTDNPRLTVRLCPVAEQNPVRVVIDRSLKIPQTYNLFNDEAETLVFCNQARNDRDNTHYINIDFHKNILPQILEELYCRNLLSLIVEGGAILLQSFIDENLFDEIHVETAENIFLGNGVKAPTFRNTVLQHEEKFGQNIIQVFKENI